MATLPRVVRCSARSCAQLRRRPWELGLAAIHPRWVIGWIPSSCHFSAYGRSLCTATAPLGTATLDTVYTVSTAKDLGALARKVLLAVHPDRVAQFGDTVRRGNETSLATFIQLMEHIQLLASHDAAPSELDSLKKEDALKTIYALPFHISSTGPDATSAQPKRVVLKLQLAPDLLYRTNVALKRDLPLDSQESWLEVGRQFLTAALQALGRPIATQLAAEVRQALTARARKRGKAGGRPTSADPRVDIEAMMRADLVLNHPLTKGMTHMWQPMSMGSPSHFSAAHRDRVVGAVLATVCSAADWLPEEAAADGWSSLAETLVDHFDAVRLYEAVWRRGVKLVIGSGYHVSASPAPPAKPALWTLHIPWNYQERELVQFLRDQIDDIDASIKRGKQPALNSAAKLADDKQRARAAALQGYPKKQRGKAKQSTAQAQNASQRRVAALIDKLRV